MASVIIIGSGPAGVSASLYTARAGLDTTIISLENGALYKAESIQNYYGIEKPISGKELVQSGIIGAKNVGVEFVIDEVVGVTYNERFVVETTSNSYEADGVILATGSSRSAPKIQGIKEFEGKGVSYCAICDAFFYKGKKVCVLGTGDYAVHEISSLLPVVESITLLTNGEEVTVELPDNVEINTHKIDSIMGCDRLESILFEDGQSLPTDGIFIAYGIAGSTELARKIGALIDGNQIRIDDKMATNIPGLYAAGDCTGGLLQISKASYEGAKAGLEIIKHLRAVKQ